MIISAKNFYDARMAKYVIGSHYCLFAVAFVLGACDGDGSRRSVSDKLLDIPVTGAESFDHSLFDIELNQLADQSQKNDNLLYVLSHLFWEKGTTDVHVSIKQLNDEHAQNYRALLVFDGIKDDAVASYLYQITLSKGTQKAWKIIDASRSWRCQPQRGHQTFDSDMCE